MGTAGDKPVRRKRRSDAIYKDDRERARAKRARRAERDRRAREDAELQVREAAGQKVYRLPDGTLFIRNVIIDVDQPYGGPPDGLDIVAEGSTGPDFRLTDDLLEPPPAADLEPEPVLTLPVRRRGKGLMSEAEGMALIRQYGYPQGKHPYDP